MQVAVTYLTEFQRSWDERFARLDDVLEEETTREKARRR